MRGNCHPTTEARYQSHWCATFPPRYPINNWCYGHRCDFHQWRITWKKNIPSNVCKFVSLPHSVFSCCQYRKVIKDNETSFRGRLKLTPWGWGLCGHLKQPGLKLSSPILTKHKNTAVCDHCVEQPLGKALGFLHHTHTHTDTHIFYYSDNFLFWYALLPV